MAGAVIGVAVVTAGLVALVLAAGRRAEAGRKSRDRVTPEARAIIRLIHDGRTVLLPNAGPHKGCRLALPNGLVVHLNARLSIVYELANGGRHWQHFDEADRRAITMAAHHRRTALASAEAEAGRRAAVRGHNQE